MVIAFQLYTTHTRLDTIKELQLCQFSLSFLFLIHRISSKMVHSATTQTYAARAASHSNPAAKRLLELMDRKKTNLCVSVDVTTAQEVLDIVKAVGPSVCMVKVSRVLSNLDMPLMLRLTAISLKILLWTLPSSLRS
jgi:hypothetical protein